MIISHKYKYVFVELPRTGSTAISKELCERYDGQEILYKHATYDEFLRGASHAERSFFVFGGIRNPIDDAVSLYFKLRTQKHFANLQKRGPISRLAYAFRTRQLRFVVNGSEDFSRFFLKFYKWPYDNWSTVSHEAFDYLLRFENLQSGFSEVRQAVGIEEQRLLPVQNRTAGRKLTFDEYYSAEAIRRARWVFAIYMKKWGYDFPVAWGLTRVEPSVLNRCIFRVLNVFRIFYWRYLRPALYAKLQRDRKKFRDTSRAAPSN